MHLITPHLKRKYEIKFLNKPLRQGIAKILKIDITLNKKFEREYLDRRQRCALCTRKEDKKIQEGCSSCKRPICDKHRLFFCPDCAGL